MAVTGARRAEILDAVADHMLLNGLASSNLRALAQAARTSDRMLLYYFADKDELVVAALATIGSRMASLLADALPPGEQAGEEFVLGELAALIRGGIFRPYMLLFLELAVFAGRGEEPYLTVAGGMADGFLGMITGRLREQGGGSAARILAMLDGALLLDCVGRQAIATDALSGCSHTAGGPEAPGSVHGASQ